ncbi:hypothetical protein [Dactylosporangium sp. CA-233914]|uniref:hypothetical protein n=1 Tax=Dactylosporangium sp. CA-233914 TaxID=3239934 RepID=UPI003D90BD79
MPQTPKPPLEMPLVRVRCEGEWHELRFAGGRLTAVDRPGHVERELALHALGGDPPGGCAGAALAWRTGSRRTLPRALRAFRAELQHHIEAGDAGTVEALLDAGMDPRVTFPDGLTLLHLLPWLAPGPARLRLLDRLLAAGLDPRARSARGYTVRAIVAHREAGAELLDALTRAGG